MLQQSVFVNLMQFYYSLYTWFLRSDLMSVRNNLRNKK